MTNLQERIAGLETRASGFKLIADLATDPDIQAANHRRAEELLDLIERLRQQAKQH